MLAKNSRSSSRPMPPASCWARVPIVLTSRADSLRTRMASCAAAVLYAHARRLPHMPAA